MPPQTQGTTPVALGHKHISQVQVITHLQQLTTHSSVKEYTQKLTNNHLLKANTKMIWQDIEVWIENRGNFVSFVRLCLKQHYEIIMWEDRMYVGNVMQNMWSWPIISEQLHLMMLYLLYLQNIICGNCWLVPNKC